eukprot:scaffold147657_cov21-Tisochrysis_lutea.AAC.1
MSIPNAGKRQMCNEMCTESPNMRCWHGTDAIQMHQSQVLDRSAVGAARFARSLTSRAGSAMRTHAPPLLKALTSATRAERSNTVRKAYAGAAAL